jgi:magnesium transporter
MVKILKTSEGTLSPVAQPQPDCWIDLVHPTAEETARYSREWDVPLDFLTDPLDADETPRLDIDAPNMLVVVRTPRFDPEAEVPFTTLPLGIIITPDRIITVSSQNDGVLEALIGGKVRNFSTANRTRFVLHVFQRTALLYLGHLKAINKRTTSIEAELQRSLHNEVLIRLLNLEKSLVYFTTSIRANELVMERLQRTRMLKMSEDEEDFLEDVIVDNKQAIEMANIYSNILSGMMDAFASIISNNISVVMKFLTSVTIILMLPTLVASIYGMNVPLPFQHSPHAFLITMLASIVLAATSVVVFVKRQWF